MPSSLASFFTTSNFLKVSYYIGLCKFFLTLFDFVRLLFQSSQFHAFDNANLFHFSLRITFEWTSGYFYAAFIYRIWGFFVFCTYFWLSTTGHNSHFLLSSIYTQVDFKMLFYGANVHTARVLPSNITR